MEKRQLLFVTHRNENITEGISYAIELAKAMDEDIMILFVRQRTCINGKFENLMSAVTFAEAGEHDTAKKMVSEGPRFPDEASRRELALILDKCMNVGVQVSVHTSSLDVLVGIRSFLKKQWGIDRVVLSPAITTDDAISSKDMMRLVRSISLPVVTMTRQSFAVAGGLEKT